MKHQYPRVTDALIISRKAEKIFTNLFPPEFCNIVKVHGEDDFGVDYRIEIVTEQELTGYEFYVQLKGFDEIESHNDISIRVSTSTLNYWKNKIIPILIVAIDCKAGKGYCQWFDKLIEIKHQQKSQTIKIQKTNELNFTKLRVYIEAYYQGFADSIRDIKIYSFYKHLFYNSILLLTAINNKFIAFLFPPKLSKKELEKHNQHYLTAYVMIYSKFVYDLKIYKIDLPDNPVHNVLKEFINNLFKIHQEICIKEVKEDIKDIGEKYIVTVDAVRARNNLPILSQMFSEINLFLAKYFLRYNELHKEQTFLFVKKDKKS